MTSSSKLAAARIHAPAASNTAESVERQQTVETVLGARLARIDMVRALRFYGSVDGIVKAMTDTLPDAIFAEPLIGSCYSTIAFARWRQVTRQAVDLQRRTGRVWGVMIDGRWFYPAVQFDKRGRQTSAFAAVLEIHRAEVNGDVEFAAWLEKPHPATGISPRVRLQNSTDSRTTEERFFDGFVPTIIDPPLRAVDEQS